MRKKALSSKVALVTGAARRVGAEISKTLHRAGMNIVIHYNTAEEEALKLAEVLNEARDRSAIALRANLADTESIKMLVQKALQLWDRLDVLVNNASRFYKTELGKTTEFAWNDLIDSNLKAPFFLAQEVMPMLAKQRGSIINITDIHAEFPLKDYSIYCVSKGGLEMLTRMLAKELAPHIRVNSVAPSVVLWPEGKNILSAEEKQDIIDRTPLARAGTPKDIAKAVLFLVRDAGYITGEVIKVDGGRSLSR